MQAAYRLSPGCHCKQILEGFSSWKAQAEAQVTDGQWLQFSADGAGGVRLLPALPGIAASLFCTALHPLEQVRWRCTSSGHAFQVLFLYQLVTFILLSIRYTDKCIQCC